MSPKCTRCKKTSKGCKCPDVCGPCLDRGLYEEAEEGQNPCECCKKCKKHSDECVCASSRCHICDSLIKDCDCRKSSASVNASGSGSVNTDQGTINFTVSAPASGGVNLKPPDLGKLKDKENLSTYISQLKRWSRCCSVKPENQADIILAIAPDQNEPLYIEMEAHFGDTLNEDREGVNKIVKWLEEKYGKTQHSSLLAKYNAFNNTVRNDKENLIDFIGRFETAYKAMEKLGEKFSANLQSFALLKQAKLPQMDYQIITKGLDYNNKEKEEENYKATKNAMIAYQTNKSNTKKDTETFVVDLENMDSDEEISDEKLEAIQVLLAKNLNKKSVKSGQNKEKKGQRNKVWKCVACLCTHKLWYPCDCDCTKHKVWQCKNYDPVKHGKFVDGKFVPKGKDHKKEERGESNFYVNFFENTFERTLKNSNVESSFIVKSQMIEDEYQPVQNLFRLLEARDLPADDGSQAGPSTSSSALSGHNYGNPALHRPDRAQPSGESSRHDDHSDDSLSSHDTTDCLDQISELIYIANQDPKADFNNAMLVDSGSPSTICSLNTFKTIRASYPAQIRNMLEYDKSNRSFQFGGGVRTVSLGVCKLPIYIMDDTGSFHKIFITVDIVEKGNVPLLLGGKSLKKMKAELDFEKVTIRINLKQNETKVDFPMAVSESGHYHLPFYVLSKGDAEHIWRSMVEEKDWQQQEMEDVLTYITKTKYPKQEEIFSECGKNRQTAKPLRKKDILKVHQVLGHPSRDKLEKMIRKSSRCDEVTIEQLKILDKCEVCSVEGRKVPRPRVAMPKSNNFNHVVTIDLKENKRYPKAAPFIIYIRDSFTKFIVGQFIRNKRQETVTKAICTQWVKIFGPPTYIQSDRGSEFLNSQLRAFCETWDIRFTATASYSAHANGEIERAHACVDRSMDKMMTAMPSLTPEEALAWSLNASNTLSSVSGFSPHMLVFGRNPNIPTLTDFKPGNQEPENTGMSEPVARQLTAMLQARETWVSLESDKVLRKALNQRIYSRPTDIKHNDWIYYKRSVDRYYVGPVKVILKDGKRLHCLRHGQNIVVNSDDVLLYKPDSEVNLPGDDFVSLPVQTDAQPSQQPVAEEQESDVGQPTDGEVVEVPDNTITVTDVDDGSQAGPSTSSSALSGHNYGNPASHRPDRAQPSGESSRHDDHSDDSLSSHDTTDCPDQRSQDYIPATSTTNSDLGYPVRCRLCMEEMSNKIIYAHCETHHGVLNQNIRRIAEKIESPAPDSVFANKDKLSPGVAVVDRAGNYLELLHNQGDVWRAKNIATAEEVNLDLIKDISAMRFIGKFANSEDGITADNAEGVQTLYTKEDFKQRVFVASEVEHSDEVTFVVNIPRYKHGEAHCVEAKKKELQDFIDFDVYDRVPKPKDAKLLGCNWVLVRKELPDGSWKTKARLTIMGNKEDCKADILSDSPTANRMTIKILLTIAAAKGWDLQTSDVTRAFLQTENLSRQIFVRPPVEAGEEPGVVWALKRACYGIVDASRSFFLNYSKHLKLQGYEPLTMDPAVFINKPNREESMTSAYAVHVDDTLAVGPRPELDRAQKEMETHFTYGDVQRPPFRFLGVNVSKLDSGGFVLDQDHYVDQLELPDIKKYEAIQKQDQLDTEGQSVFRSLSSKLNMLALTSRPDFSFQAKCLTTRFGKATKSDLYTAIRLLRKAKQESTKMVIPDIGPVSEWLIVGYSDASSRSGGSSFSTGGQVIMLVNKITQASSIIFWASKKIDRVCTSSMAAEVLSLQKLSSHLFLTKQLLKNMLGKEGENIPCLALTDNHDTFSAVHTIKPVTDPRMQADVVVIRQAIHEDKTISELRFTPADTQLADCLTKITKNGEDLMKVLRTGHCFIPGGTVLRDSTAIACKTWHDLLRAEEAAAQLSSGSSPSSSASPPAPTSS